MKKLIIRKFYRNFSRELDRNIISTLDDEAVVQFYYLVILIKCIEQIHIIF